MEVTALCFRLVTLGFILLGRHVQNSLTSKSVSGGVRLHITPNRQQHFEYDRMAFHCESNDGSTKLKGIRNTEEFTPSCNFKRTTSGSTCSIDKAYPGDSGEYWCETKKGERSNAVNITVTGGAVILESPALPVIEGETVTLRCNTKTKFNKLVFFYKDDVSVQISYTEEMRIKNFSKSTEGLYRCNIPDVGSSPESQLVVRDPVIAHSAGHSVMSIAVPISIMAMVLPPVGFLLFRRYRVFFQSVFSKTKRAAPTSEEDNRAVYEVDNEDDDTAHAVSVIKQIKDKDTEDAGDNLSLCLETNQSRNPPTKKVSTPGSHISSCRLTLNPADQDLDFTEDAIIYSGIKKKTRYLKNKQERVLML
ncbi:sialoadhesin-like isoform X2 [Anabas testudineus]|uniref:sialoadhesin-like isoform X2 n=1 Tax=Anabas testudineus TaxID=64144 RepID=UPI000E45557C|nr:sialoadhesin-like isoform X2 [Anabas testudineus]